MEMYFIWRLFSNKVSESLYDIINSGYIKSSEKSKNIGLFGHSGSKFVYMSYYSKKKNNYFTKKGGAVRFYINPFYFKKIYFNLGWQSEPTKESFKINKENLYKVEDDIIANLKNKKNLEDIDILMSHELLTKKNINIKKAVFKIELNKNINNLENIVELIKNKYPNIKIKKVEI